MIKIAPVAVMIVACALMLAASKTLGLPVAVIVNASNPLESLSGNQLRDLLEGNLRVWPNKRRVTVVQREAGSQTLETVVRAVLHSSVHEYNRQLLNLEFQGKEPVALKTLNSDDGACVFVTNVPGAIAFISAESTRRAACDAQVKVVRVQDHGLSDAEYMLR